MSLPALSGFCQTLRPQRARRDAFPAGELPRRRRSRSGRRRGRGRLVSAVFHLHKVHRGGAGLPLSRLPAGVPRNRCGLFLEVQQQRGVVTPRCNTTVLLICIHYVELTRVPASQATRKVTNSVTKHGCVQEPAIFLQPFHFL